MEVLISPPEVQGLPPNRKFLACISLFILICFDASGVSATTVIAIVTPEGIIVGTDAKEVTALRLINPIGSRMIPRKAELIANDRILVSSSGLVHGQGYDFFDWIKKISADLPDDISVEDFVHVLERESAAEFQDMNTALQTKEVAGPSFEFCTNFVRYLIAGYRDARPMVFKVEFYIDWQRKLLVGPLTTTFNSPHSGTELGLYSIGEVTALIEITDRNSYAYKQASLHAPKEFAKFFAGGNLTECEALGLIKALIKIEEEVSPSKVGGIGQIFFIPVSGPIRESKCNALTPSRKSSQTTRKQTQQNP
jgi:hypothetical protein